MILVSTYEIEDLPPGALASGAVGYVNKDELSPRVVRRIVELAATRGRRVRWAGGAGHGRALRRLRPHREGAAEGAEAVGHVDESVALVGGRRRGVEAGTIVADFEAENTVGLPDPHRDRRRLTGVLAGVLQCFHAKYTAASMSAP